MSEAPRAPYPPDLADADERAGASELGDLVDAVVSGADWANRRAFKLSLRRVELHRCRLTGADLAEAGLSDVLFLECRLDLVGLRFARLERVVFRACRMGECDLHEASLQDVLFEGCELRGATLSSARLKRVELRGCDLTGLQGVEALRGARMPWEDVIANAALFAASAGIEVVD